MVFSNVTWERNINETNDRITYACEETSLSLRVGELIVRLAAYYFKNHNSETKDISFFCEYLVRPALGSYVSPE